jgi:hypothetical protein
MIYFVKPRAQPALFALFQKKRYATRFPNLLELLSKVRAAQTDSSLFSCFKNRFNLFSINIALATVKLIPFINKPPSNF